MDSRTAELDLPRDHPHQPGSDGTWGLFVCAGDEMICDLYEHYGTHFGRFDKDGANARLIAAAPVMYDYIAERAEAGDAEAKRIVSHLTWQALGLNHGVIHRAISGWKLHLRAKRLISVGVY